MQFFLMHSFIVLPIELPIVLPMELPIVLLLIQLYVPADCMPIVIS